MKDKTAFGDASAIAPLCLHQITSPRARQILRQHPNIWVWWATVAEVRSSFARAVRTGRADNKEFSRSLSKLGRLSFSWREVEPHLKVREFAIQLLDSHPLRTGDALQLAAALHWCKEKPRRKTFVCFDDQLADAAKAVGFTVITS
ncbi:MAG: type II toxin-antitoxin system VapC family toxin [Blastocatellia bacterium]